MSVGFRQIKIKTLQEEIYILNRSLFVYTNSVNYPSHQWHLSLTISFKLFGSDCT